MSYSIKDYKDVEAKVIMVTPAMAAEMLTKNYNNRKMKSRDVKKYAEAIKNGEWEVTNQGIGFSKNGALKDGQNRLSAIVLANMAAPILVVTGLANDTSMIDRNRVRTVSNVMAMSGERKEYSTREMTTIANALLYLVGIDHPTESQTIKFIKNDGEMLLSAIRATNFGSKHALCNKAACYAVAYCALYNNLTEHMVRRFFEVANSGFSNGDWETAAIVFRNYLLNEYPKFTSRSGMSEHLMQGTKALNDFCNNKPRRNQYSGEPVFWAKTEEHIINDIL